MGRRRRTRPAIDPLPAAPERRPGDPLAIALVVARHAIPLLGLVAFGASVENFLLLSVFDVAVAVACIAVVALAVSTRQEVGDRGATDAIAALVFLLFIGIAAAFALTGLFGWVCVLLVAWTPEGLWNAALWWSAFAIVAFSVPGVVQRYREDMAAKIGDDARRRRDEPAVGVLLLSAGLVFVLSGYAGDFGHAGRIVVALVVTALFVVRDLKPDALRRLMGTLPAPPA
jgi:hypothetical protein